VARRVPTNSRLGVGSGAGLELTNEGANRSMRLLGFESFSGRCKTVEIRASAASARGIPTARLLLGRVAWGRR